MQKKITKTILGISTMVVLVGCGGSSDPQSITKVIMDDPIVGLNYECIPSGKKDKTNNKGEFTCNIGDKVTFSIGEYVIGSTESSSGTADTMRIADFGVDQDAITDIRQLLQTIDDTEGDAKIVIPESFEALNGVEEKPGDEGFENAIEEKLGKPLVEGHIADKNADEAYWRQLFSGKTFYAIRVGGGCAVGDDTCSESNAGIEALRFNVALTQVEKADDPQEHSAIELNGDKAILVDMDRDYLRIKSVDSDRIEIEIYHETEISPYETWYYYNSKAKAEEYLNSHGGGSGDHEQSYEMGDLVSGHFDFVDENNSLLTIPNNIWLSITPEEMMNDGDWISVHCKVNTNGDFGSECYIHREDAQERIRELFVKNSTRLYQVIIYHEMNGDTYMSREELDSGYGTIQKDGDPSMVHYEDLEHSVVLVEEE